ncbi:MAG: hypothetical protein JNJ77_12250 [Planctomycetia bacterium]|nr:hypothetical protein [Planctomycetia bacterium]
MFYVPLVMFVPVLLACLGMVMLFGETVEWMYLRLFRQGSYVQWRNARNLLIASVLLSIGFMFFPAYVDHYHHTPGEVTTYLIRWIVTSLGIMLAGVGQYVVFHRKPASYHQSLLFFYLTGILFGLEWLSPMRWVCLLAGLITSVCNGWSLLAYWRSIRSVNEAPSAQLPQSSSQRVVQENECLACGAKMPEVDTVCSQCGWTYNE